MRKLNKEFQLVCRITHLRALLHHTKEVQIVATLKEFIAETEVELVTLMPVRKAALH